jgi:hypothetical protein
MANKLTLDDQERMPSRDISTACACLSWWGPNRRRTPAAWTALCNCIRMPAGAHGRPRVSARRGRMGCDVQRPRGHSLPSWGCPSDEGHVRDPAASAARDGGRTRIRDVGRRREGDGHIHRAVRTPAGRDNGPERRLGDRRRVSPHQGLLEQGLRHRGSSCGTRLWAPIGWIGSRDGGRVTRERRARGVMEKAGMQYEGTAAYYGLEGLKKYRAANGEDQQSEDRGISSRNYDRLLYLFLRCRGPRASPASTAICISLHLSCFD